MFAFPPLIDVKIDQPEVELVMDRDKVAALGPQPADRSARTSARWWAATYVNRFNIAGRSYKVIPQLKRVERLNPDQLEEHLRHRARTAS